MNMISSTLLLPLLLLGSSATYSHAFNASMKHRRMYVQQRPGVLYSRPDSSAAVEDALRMSKEFGPTSKEARLAWETVEEMDAADLSPAMSSSGDDGEVDEADVHSKEYKVQILALNRLLMDTQGKLSQIKTLASNLKELDVEDPTLSRLPDSASGLKTVLQEAKAASEVHGADSKESENAWNEVDFCVDIMEGGECNVDSHYRYSAAALKAHHVYDAVVDATFLQEAEDALCVIENLQRFTRIEAKRMSS